MGFLDKLRGKRKELEQEPDKDEEDKVKERLRQLGLSGVRSPCRQGA